MSLKKVYIIVAAVLALAGAATYFWNTREKFDWPQQDKFVQTENKAPSMVVQVEPDFAYRTGDIVPVVVFIKQQPGTTVDITSMALEGGFEIRGEPEVDHKDLNDGSRIWRLGLKLQSLKPARKVSSNISLVWEVTGDRETKELRAKLVDAYTSYTWDGRTEIKDGPLAPLTGGHLWLSGGLLFGSLGIFVWGIWYLRRSEVVRKEIERAYKASPRVVYKRRVDKAWAKIAAGDLSPAHFDEIGAATRQFFELDAVLLKDVQFWLNHHPQTKQIYGVLARCQWGAYAPAKLPAKELEKLRAYLDEVVDRKKPVVEEPAAGNVRQVVKVQPKRVAPVKPQVNPGARKGDGSTGGGSNNK